MDLLFQLTGNKVQMNSPFPRHLLPLETSEFLLTRTDKSCPSPDYARAREMLSLCILEMSVVRLSPSLAAAPLRPPMIQLVSAKA